MSRLAVEKVTNMHVEAERRRGVAFPNVERLKKRIVDNARKLDAQRGVPSGKER